LIYPILPKAISRKLPVGLGQGASRGPFNHLKRGRDVNVSVYERKERKDMGILNELDK